MFIHMPPKERVVYVLLLSVFLFGAGYVGAQRFRQPPKIEIELPKGAKNPFQVAPLSADQPSGADLVVHVVGAVKLPGLQHLAAGARIADAVKAAGGASAEANLDAINLAAKLEDGQQVVVPKKGSEGDDAIGPPPASKIGGKHPARPINLGTSSYAQLEELPGVGPSMAEKLMAFRLKHGHLTLDDLRAIPGLGPKRLEKIKPWVR